MPMHYPPLADGTYRYGDPPQPLPSPVPGPDADSPPPQPPFPAHDGGSGAGPPPDATPPGSRARGGLATAAVFGAAALVVVVLGVLLSGVIPGPWSDTGSDTGRGTDAARGPIPQLLPPPERAPGSATFAVDGSFTVVSTPADPVSGDDTGCDLPVSLSDIGEGTTITLLEGSTSVITTARLAYSGGDLASCTFTFGFPDVPAGGSYYVVELPGRGQLTYTEDELRAGVDITLGR
ncbi:hypothetical protein C3V38_03785 [Dietzia sp. oral taxon 368]|uniref:hypothetical protein n=1 Tax=Dietzia sp. oral taxon 368 TaxID=712270 RepID=UPI000D08AB2A|nr:hypothetical protein [Dietzia sp. oral taxon 368]AVM63651.1 hypothetical protein C3V38_03785 [Dietzia sp. oral taxon 368]